MSEPRKHHYVPVFYQKHFVNQHGLLWLYDRSLKTCRRSTETSLLIQSGLSWGRRRRSFVSTIKQSGSEEQDPVPRYTVDKVNPDDSGSFMKLTRHPTRYFYVKGLAP